MHFSRLALLLAPLLARGSPIHSADDALKSASSDAPTDFASFDIYCQDDDEAFRLNINAFDHPAERNRLSCGDSLLRLDGQDLQQQWHHASPGGLTGTASTTITLESIFNGDNHTLDLSVSSSCLTGSPAAQGDQKDRSGERIVQVTTVVVDRIDGRPAKTSAGFNIYLDQQDGQILKINAASRADLDRLSQLRSSSGADREDEFARESEHLTFLQTHFDQLSRAIDAQKIRVSTLGDGTSEREDCSLIGCVFVSFIEKAKSCVQVITEKLPSFTGRPGAKCARDQTFLGFMNSAPPCDSETAQASQSTPAKAIDAPIDFENQSASSDTGVGEPLDKANPDRVRDYILVPVAVLATVFCFTWASFSVCRNCCSPRAKADWRARREERRNRRQYRQLQRQHALSQWWSRLLGKPMISSNGDYEEKRSLILSQEQVLERSMQDEIYRLRLEAGMTAEQIRAVEQNGVGCGEEHLPEYHSRATDGPPSYRTDPSDTGSAPLSRTTSSSGRVPSISDVTPDSSIANLSPRHSSETLRTDASLAGLG